MAFWAAAIPWGLAALSAAGTAYTLEEMFDLTGSEKRSRWDTEARGESLWRQYADVEGDISRQELLSGLQEDPSLFRSDVDQALSSSRLAEIVEGRSGLLAEIARRNQNTGATTIQRQLAVLSGSGVL